MQTSTTDIEKRRVFSNNVVILEPVTLYRQISIERFRIKMH
jgi:hypothetical protein